jgi:hypothetical protein
MTLQSILSLAVRQERIASNPVSRVKKPRPSALREVAPIARVTGGAPLLGPLRGRHAPEIPANEPAAATSRSTER